MGGHHLTIGDISIFFELGLFLILFKFDLHEHYPKLHGWFNRVSTHEAVVGEWSEYAAWVLENIVPKVHAPKEDQFDLYFNPLSQPSASLKTLLDISGVKYHPHIISLEKGEHKSPEYLKIHPMGQVPCLLFNGIPMVESGSVLRFIAD